MTVTGRTGFRRELRFLNDMNNALSADRGRLCFSTFYAHVPKPNRGTAGFHPHTPTDHQDAIALINILFASARFFHPDARFSILTSVETDLSGIDIPFERIDTPVARGTLMYDRMAGQRRQVAELAEGETLLLLDSDMVIQSDLSHLEAIDFDVALTWRPQAWPINGGFIALRNRDGNRALNFFDDLLFIYRKRYSHERQWDGDQSSLRALIKTRTEWGGEMLASPYDRAKIHFLHSDEYNYSPGDLEDIFDLGALRERRLLHFKGKRKRSMPAYFKAYRTARRSILTPYPIPAAMAGRKIANIGDGFILRSIERLFGAPASDQIFSPRVAPSPAEEATMAASDLVILGGANQLNDRYGIWPGLTAEKIRARGYRLLPVGIGLHGSPEMAAGMSEETAAIIRAIHERIEFSSWRCPSTVAYLEASLPELKGRFLMTGCPVMFDTPLLEESRFHDGADHLAVTITERGGEWFRREHATLRMVRDRYPDARRSLVLHQDFTRLRNDTAPSLLDGERDEICARAMALGFEIHRPDADEAIAFYRTVDMHFGSRVHAHLLMLSRNRKSFVTAFDDRTTGLARAFGFPILRLHRVDEALEFDFERVRERAKRAHATMQRFVAAAEAAT